MVENSEIISVFTVTSPTIDLESFARTGGEADLATGSLSIKAGSLMTTWF
jgi:hypothetical protein